MNEIHIYFTKKVSNYNQNLGHILWNTLKMFLILRKLMIFIVVSDEKIKCTLRDNLSLRCTKTLIIFDRIKFEYTSIADKLLK